MKKQFVLLFHFQKIRSVATIFFENTAPLLYFYKSGAVTIKTIRTKITCPVKSERYFIGSNWKLDIKE